MTADGKKLLARWKKQAEQQGWRVETTGAGHRKWWRPDGTIGAVTPATPGGGRVPTNLRARLRRAGLVVR